MIDLTPLDVRKKKGDFRQGLRGYDRDVVDEFLDLTADRLEELVRENTALKERVAVLSEAISAYRERERALNEALVSAQQLREEMRSQAARDAEIVLREARSEAERIVARAKDEARAAADANIRIRSQRAWYLRSFRAFAERQLGEIEQEEERLRELHRMQQTSADEASPMEGPSAYPAAEQSSMPPGEPTSTWLSSIDGEGEEGR